VILIINEKGRLTRRTMAAIYARTAGFLSPRILLAKDTKIILGSGVGSLSLHPVGKRGKVP